MKTYLAGTSVSNPKEEQKIQDLFKQGYKLHSYFHCKDGFESKWFKMNKKNKVELFMDSGAFSAKTQNIKIDINKYIKFIYKNVDNIDVYANLDVIGNAEKTYKNQQKMIKAGLNPLPVFHYGEDKKWLQRYLDEGYEYICLGGLARHADLIPFLDYVFSNFICDEKGIPKVKVHGFALTSLKLMLRYPWYSVDSTSWVVTGRLGSVYIPNRKAGKWEYLENSYKIAVSTKNPGIKEAGQHITNISPIEKKIVLEYLAEKGYVLGKSTFKSELQEYKLQENEKWAEKKPDDKNVNRQVETIVEPGISNIYQLRDELNILYFLDLEKAMPEWPWVFTKEQETLF